MQSANFEVHSVTDSPAQSLGEVTCERNISRLQMQPQPSAALALINIRFFLSETMFNLFPQKSSTLAKGWKPNVLTPALETDPLAEGISQQ